MKTRFYSNLHTYMVIYRDADGELAYDVAYADDISCLLEGFSCEGIQEYDILEIKDLTDLK